MLNAVEGSIKMRAETHRKTAVTFQGDDRVEGGQSKTRILMDPAMFNKKLEPLATIIFKMEKVKRKEKEKKRQGERTRGIKIGKEKRNILLVFDTNIHVVSQGDSPRFSILLEVIRV